MLKKKENLALSKKLNQKDMSTFPKSDITLPESLKEGFGRFSEQYIAI